jgi:hypothetical protein
MLTESGQVTKRRKIPENEPKQGIFLKITDKAKKQKKI